MGKSNPGIVPICDVGENDVGLFDMLGNVFEWTASRYVAYQSGEDREDHTEVTEALLRVPRGGSFGGHARVARCAFRLSFRPSNRNSAVGFRPARTYPF